MNLSQPVAALGAGAAQAPGVPSSRSGTAIRIGSIDTHAMGVLAEAGAANEVNGAVLVPSTAPVAPGNTTATPQ